MTALSLSFSLSVFEWQLISALKAAVVIMKEEQRTWYITGKPPPERTVLRYVSVDVSAFLMSYTKKVSVRLALILYLSCVQMK